MDRERTMASTYFVIKPFRQARSQSAAWAAPAEIAAKTRMPALPKNRFKTHFLL